MFDVESSNTDGFFGPVTVYRQRETGMRAIFGQLSGPVLSAQIVVATGAGDDSGLAHTLEHLVFTGSALPRHHRGWLDTLATRALSTGTNAYTAEDHTAFSVATAGGPRLFAAVLAALAAHVANPTLSDASFATEVFHVDASGNEVCNNKPPILREYYAPYEPKCLAYFTVVLFLQLGVVFSEMAARESSEADRVDQALRTVLFANSAYAVECGGKTDSIRFLDNNKIKQYHNEFYTPDNISVLICGNIDHAIVLDQLDSLQFLQQAHTVSSKSLDSLSASSSTRQSISFSSPAFPLKKPVVETVFFPAHDDSHGSMVFAWHGPDAEDFKTIVSLDIILRLLQDTSASPLYQAFVENDDPWCAEVDYDIKSFLKTALVVYFSGVNCGKNSDHMDIDSEFQNIRGNTDFETDTDVESIDYDESDEMNRNDSDDSDNYEDDDNDDDQSRSENEDPEVTYVEPVVFKEKLINLFKSFTMPRAISEIDLKITVDKYIRKIKEAFEEDPHEVVANYIIPDITRFHIQTSLSQENSKKKFESKMPIVRGSVLDIAANLLNEPINYWADLIQKWFLDQHPAQFIVKPSRAMAAELTAKEAKALQIRKEMLGESGLEKLGIAAAEAFAANKVNLPEEILNSFPPIPNIANLPKLSYEMTLHETLSTKNGVRRPFAQAQVVTTETLFTHCRIAFNISNLPSRLRPYLVLFQELLFQCPIAATRPKGKEIDYRAGIRKTSETFVSYEASVGFGNDVWSCGWLAEVFMVTISSDTGKFADAIEWMIHVILFSKFSQERIVSAIQKLSADLYDVKRDGSCLLSAVSTRLMSFRKEAVGTASAAAAENDLQISIFKQAAFLKSLTKQIKTSSGQGKLSGIKGVIEALDSLKLFLISGFVNSPGFLQLALPIKTSSAAAGVLKNDKEMLALFLNKWDKEVSSFHGLKKTKPVLVERSELCSAFPFPRSSFDLSMLDTETFGHGVVVPVEGVTASYLSIIVPCDVLKTSDYYAVTLLAELFSRAEGPIYTSIRGKGFAYDASVSLSAWSSQLAFDMSESSDPQQGLVEFFNILSKFDTDSGFAEIASPFNIETARASVVYRVVIEKSTGGACIGSTLRRCLRGYMTDQQEMEHQNTLFAISSSDLKRVYNQYFKQFLDPLQRIVVLITKPQKSVDLDSIIQLFAENPLKIDLRLVKLSDLDI
ncbi:hypothetical protein HK100_001465 [Physocladia obscura]|uniref:Uncharacterized protein n=1 Tax=Physocladia obscura TaxID=109957 RepID=A0AAD5XB13_9FUNG|nr:hypothetical protein HK100_001465 [Physocladia obscura]